MVLSTNLSAQVSAAQWQATQSRLAKSLARLSSGSRIVSPADDAAGLAVATRLGAQAGRLEAAARNVSNALSYLQTQDGYLQAIGKALTRIGELALLVQDATQTSTDRGLYHAEYSHLSWYIFQATARTFNGVSLFDTRPLAVPLDAEGAALTLAGVNTLAYVDATAVRGFHLASTTAAALVLQRTQAALEQLASDRALLGASQQRLHLVAQELTTTRQNLSSAVSRIQDVDVAEESTRFAKENILAQSGTALLAQANQLPQAVLKLLQ